MGAHMGSEGGDYVWHVLWFDCKNDDVTVFRNSLGTTLECTVVYLL